MDTHDVFPSGSREHILDIRLVVLEEVFGEHSRTRGLSEDIELGFPVFIILCVPELADRQSFLLCEHLFSSCVEEICKDIRLGKPLRSVGTSTSCIVPSSIIRRRSVAMDGNKQHIVFSERLAHPVHSSGTNGKRNVLVFRHEQIRIVPSFSELMDENSCYFTIIPVLPENPVR